MRLYLIFHPFSLFFHFTLIRSRQLLMPNQKAGVSSNHSKSIRIMEVSPSKPQVIQGSRSQSANANTTWFWLDYFFLIHFCRTGLVCFHFKNWVDFRTESYLLSWWFVIEWHWLASIWHWNMKLDIWWNSLIQNSISMIDPTVNFK